MGLGLVQYLHKVFEELCGDSCSFSIESSSELERVVLQQSKMLTQKMDDIEDSIASVQSSIHSLHRTLPTHVRYEIKFDRLEQIINKIWSTYSSFKYYQENMQRMERHTLEDFAVSVTSHHSGSIRNQLSNLHGLSVPRALSVSSGIFETIASEVKVSHQKLIYTFGMQDLIMR